MSQAVNQYPRPSAVPLPGMPEELPMEVLSFTVGAEEYGIGIQHVQELRGYDAVTAIPGTPDFVKGFVNLRGAIVPIVDLRIMFDLASPSYDQFTVVIVTNVGRHTVGMVVDAVSDVCALSSDQLRPIPDMGAALSTGFLMGMGMIDSRMLILIDVDKLILGADAGLFAETMT